MNRLFLFQQSYKEEYNIDGIALATLIRQYKPWFQDQFLLVHNNIAEDEYAVCVINKWKAAGRKIIPVGTLEFVQTALDYIYGRHIEMTPIEIPEALRGYTGGRKYEIIKGIDIPKECLADSKNWFIKDASHLKKWNNLLIDGDCASCIEPDTNYVVSERVNIISEYRVFVHRDEILAVQNYLGDPSLFPNSTTLHAIVQDYKVVDHPKSYTADIGLILRPSGSVKTSLIEIHPFVSCGLYGFYDRDILDMLEDGIDWYVANSIQL